MAMKALPWITGAAGTLPGLQKGNLVEAIMGGGMGAWGGSSLRGPIGGLTRTAMKNTPKAVTGLTGFLANRMPNTALGNQVGSALLDSSLLANNAVTKLPGAVGAVKNILPWAGVAAAVPLTGGLTGLGKNAIQGGGGNVLGAGASQATRDGNLVPMSSLPANYQPNANNMVRGPEGNWWYYYNPGGVPAGNRLNRQLDAITHASNLNTVGNALFGQTERVARAEFERQAAAEQLKANIAQAKEMAIASQAAGLKIGTDAGVGMANAMSNRSQFRYL